MQVNSLLLMDKQGLQKEKCRRSFYYFVKQAFKHIEPTSGEFVDNWHIGVIAEALDLLMNDKLPENKIYINVPPTHMKSLLCLLMIAWVWIDHPQKSFFYISYALDLATEQTDKLRNFLLADWYQIMFKIPMDENNNAKSDFKNKFGGEVIASGIGGQVTGKHVDAVIMDDLIKRDDSNSDAKIEEVNGFFADTIPTRYKDAKNGKEIIICQRLNQRDVIGYIQGEKLPYLSIIIPAYFEGQQYSIPGYPELNDPREEGELLWPEKYGLKEYKDFEKRLSVLGFSGQFQQRPSPVKGAIFKKAYFENRIHNDEIIGRIISIDTSFGKGDFTSILVAEFRNDKTLFIREVFRDRLEFPQIIEKIGAMAIKYKYRLKK